MTNTDLDIVEHIFDNLNSVIIEPSLSSQIAFTHSNVKFNLYSYDDGTAYLYSAGERLDVDPLTVYKLFLLLNAKSERVIEIKRKTKLDAQREKLGLPTNAESIESTRSATPNLEDILNHGKDRFADPSLFEKFKSWLFR